MNNQEPGWTWPRIMVLAAISFTLGVITWNVWKGLS